MIKSVIVKKFIASNKYVIHPELIVKDSGSFAIPPYVTEYNLSTEELLNKILYVLEFSKETTNHIQDPKIGYQEYLKAMEVKTMKALHDNTINLSLYVRDGIINFIPSENKGSKLGFVGLGLDQNIVLPFNSSREELLKALELALSKCK
ncbi:hypothetical protein [Flavobacterium macrobrachii]|uniref:DUF1436 family protein n=1 Tax=Flavobacterium macrobrachii TaxID=591204 RepID=A0ABS2CSQ6_9FLAO|nr:hypothetical protein [Flavobacterium macrobrachii]MBM6497970.1 hypothetical protein [Flavobacterium macrobrachii]